MDTEKAANLRKIIPKSIALFNINTFIISSMIRFIFRNMLKAVPILLVYEQAQ